MVLYVRTPCNGDGSHKNYAQRRAERIRQDAERRSETPEPVSRDSFYDLPYSERRRIRRAQEQGRREGMQRAAIEEQARQQAELDAIPEHERRPRNQWRDRAYCVQNLHERRLFV